MKPSRGLRAVAALAILVAGVFVWAQDKPQPAESERQVKEAEIPAAALAALKKLAGAAAITEFAEEIEYGSKFYEGSWKGPDGNIDALVTETGDLVELEEASPAAKIPGPARAYAEKQAGKDAKLSWEKKTYIMYEVHYKKGDKTEEILLTPDGRAPHGEAEQDGDKDEDDKK